MNSSKVPNWINNLILICSASIIIGFFVSRALMSIGMVGLCLPFFLYQFKENIQFFKSTKIMWVGVFIIAVMFSTFFYSENLPYFSHRMQIKLTLLFFPLAFVVMRKVEAKTLRIIFYIFLACTFLETLGALFNYALRFEKITRAYIAGQVIPLPFKLSHTRFSLMLTSSIFISYFLIKQPLIIWKENFEKRLLQIILISHFLFLHVLSVRSGLLAFYSVVGILIIHYTIQQKHYVKGGIALAGLIITPIIFYFTVPTIYHKINYMVRDINNFRAGNSVYNYSDGNRLLSMKIALELGGQSPWFGIGLGDIEDEMHNIYETKYPEFPFEQRLTPHNQFIYSWLSAGVAGLLSIVLLALIMLWQKEFWKWSLPICIHVIYMSSFISEATLENQLGAISYGFLFWLSAAWAFQKSEEIKE